MEVYKIFEGDDEINRIVANKDFVAPYCEENGYTYELEVPPPPPEPEPVLTEQEATDAMLVDHEYRITMLEMGL